MFQCVQACCLTCACAHACMSVPFEGRGQKEEGEVERILQAEGRAFANVGRQRSSSM